MRVRFVGLLLLLGTALPAAAQDEEAGPEDFEPAVDVSLVDEAEPADTLAAARRVADSGEVMDEIDLDRTEITGNQELPKVLYIVPWQKSDPGDLMGRPVNTLLDEVLEPIDRGEFVRQVRYYEDLQEE